MVYLYAGLGIAMISGISAMMQIGNNINNITNISSLKNDAYSSSSLPKFDREIMKYLYTQSVPENDICDYIKNKISSPQYENGEFFKSTSLQTPSRNLLFSQACALVSKNDKHRVIITPKTEGNYKYGFYSCLIENEPYCKFEINK